VIGVNEIPHGNRPGGPKGESHSDLAKKEDAAAAKPLQSPQQQWNKAVLMPRQVFQVVRAPAFNAQPVNKDKLSVAVREAVMDVFKDPTFMVQLKTMFESEGAEKKDKKKKRKKKKVEKETDETSDYKSSLSDSNASDQKSVIKDFMDALSEIVESL
jgi:CelD/BcsL family acetyltransferase involved in cellulose biosynthesis